MEAINPMPDLDYLKRIQVKETITNAIDDTGNPFPIEIFPKPIQKIITETKKLNFCEDYIGGFMLGIISSAIGNSCKIQVKKGWIESSVLFLCIVGEPGAGKSAPLKFAVKPFQKIDVQSYKDYQEKMQIYKENEKRKPEDREDIPLPQLSKKIINDATMEAIHLRHQYNSRGLIMVMDELAGFFNNMNRYSKGSEQQQWLSIFSGSAISIDRKSGEPLMIESPHISSMGGIQNGVFHKIFSDKVDDGMLDRYLLCVPELSPENKWNNEEISHDVYDLWERIVYNVLAIPMDEEPNVFHFSNDAKKALFEWQNSIENSHNSIISGVDAKLQTYVIRFCLILHILNDSINSNFPTEVQIETVHDALKLYKYFRTNAIKMRQDMNLIDVFEGLDENKKMLFELLPIEFTYSEGKDIMAESELMGESTFKLFLKNKSLFSKIKQGNYKKILQ